MPENSQLIGTGQTYFKEKNNFKQMNLMNLRDKEGLKISMIFIMFLHGPVHLQKISQSVKISYPILLQRRTYRHLCLTPAGKISFPVPG
jgi:hypothetical protein